MFARRFSLEVTVRISLIVVILFNALVPTVALAKSTYDSEPKLIPETTTIDTNVSVEQSLPLFTPPQISYPVQTTPDPDEPASPIPTKGQVEFTIIADPAIVPMNGLVRFDVFIRNNSEQELTGLVFTDQLESGLEYSQENTSPVTYNMNEKKVQSSIDHLSIAEELTFSYAVTLTAAKRNAIKGKIWLHDVELKSNDNNVQLRTNAAIGVDISNTDTQSEIAALQTNGGWNSLGRLKIYMAQDGVAQNALIIASPTQRAEKGPELQFNLDIFETSALTSDAKGKLDEQAITLKKQLKEPFKHPAYLEINLDDYVDLNNIPAGQEPYVATYDEMNKIWVKVPILEQNLQSNSVTVEAAHFSTWGAGLGSSMPQNGANVLLFDQPYTSLFTGAARYSLPIWTPPGRGGMQPDLSLSYSSSTVDGVLGDVQAPWVGVGWNMDGVEIVRKITTSDTGYGYENNFALTINGTLYDLVVDPEHQNHYFTKRSSFLYIERHNYALGNVRDINGALPPNKTKEWWEVVTTDGTRYRLGWNSDSEQLALMYGYSCTTNGDSCTTPDGAYVSLGYAGRANDLVAMRWRVDKIDDKHANYMSYRYEEWHPASPLVPQFDRASFVKEIKYTGHTNLDPKYLVQFNYMTRPGDVPTQFKIWDNWDDQLLNTVQICFENCTMDNVIRTYAFGYSVQNVPNSNGTLALTDITISSGNFSADGVTGSIVSSPKIKFTYENKPNRAVSGGTDAFTYPRLTKIENGYGGSLNYTYEHDGRGTDSWYNYRVKTVTVQTGTSLPIAAIRGYAYSLPIYTAANNLGELIGYTDVTETTYAFDGTSKLADTVHHFGTIGLDTGFELITESKDPAGTVLHKSVSTYVTDNSQAPFVGWNYRYLSQTESYVRNGAALVLTSKTRYVRDGGSGNLTVREDYLGSILYRKQFYEYRPNFDPAVHILDKATRQLLVDANNNLLSETRFIYDGITNYAENSLSKGELTLVQKLLNDVDTSDTKYEYDQYGNVVRTCVSREYGTVDNIPANGICSQVEYDTVVFTYPEFNTNPLGQTSATQYVFQLGLPYRVFNPNGVTKLANGQYDLSDEWATVTSYDHLGRTLSVTPPGLPTGTVGTRYTYPAVVNGTITAPYSIQMELWDQQANTYRSVWGIYDGMSRMLETQVWDSDRAQLLITGSEFNAQGLTARQTLPYYASGTGGTYIQSASQFTEMIYDALERVTQTTSTGNIISYTQYDGLTTTSIDPNGNKVVRTTDGLGRLKYIHEYNGSAVYAATTLSYDAADRLLKTIDAQNNVTALQYDHLGRKTGMDDPDMGTAGTTTDNEWAWVYQYDALGGMITQKDARGQTLSFDYDDLGRLLEKKDADQDIVLASYTYGATSPEIGYRKTMSDQSGNASWSYTNYGRTVTETKVVGTLPQKSMTTTSDWLGRVLAIAYPDNESVAYQYDALGRAKSFKSDQNMSDFAAVGYNELSQIMNINLMSGVRVENQYNATTHRLENRSAFKGSDTFLDFDYLYDPAGNITQLTDRVLDETHTYQYDSLNRLLSAEAVNETDYSYRQTFEYDKVGNILTRQDWETSDLIFKSDFEDTTVTGWSSVVSDVDEIWTIGSNGFPPVSGDRSMVFDIKDNNALYVEDTTPSIDGNETSYRARFYFNPHSLMMAAGDILDLFAGYKIDGTQVLRVQLQRVIGDYQVRISVLSDIGTWTDSAWQTIPNQWTSIEISYLSAVTSGSLALWLNGTTTLTLSPVDNDTSPINKVRLGGMGIEPSTRGQILYDAFESHRSAYIGVLPQRMAYSGNLLPVAYHISSSSEIGIVSDAPQLQEQATDTPTLTPTSTFTSTIPWTPTATIPTAANTLTPTATLTPTHSATPSRTLEATSPPPDIYTKVFLRMDGSDASTSFVDQTGKVWTAYGNAQLDTAQSKFGGASSLFDGSGDYVSTTDSPDFDFGSGDFSIDFWVKRNTNGFQRIAGQMDGAVTISTISWFLQFASNDSVEGGIYSGSIGYKATSSHPVTADGSWHHIAMVRSGNTITLYIDGIADGTVTVAGVIPNNSAYKVAIGQLGEYNAQHLNGWIDEFRVSKAIARWTSNFIPPNASNSFGQTHTPSPLAPTISLLLMDGNDASTSFVDQTGRNWTAYGNAQLDTAQSKFGGASGFFDGSGDYISTADSPDFDFGSGDFTIDFWVKRNTNGFQRIAGQMDSGTVTTISWYLDFGSDDLLHGVIYSGSTPYIATSIHTVKADGSWHHIAMVRYGNTITLYIDGAADGTVNVAGVVPNNSAYNVSVGRIGEYNTEYLNGWIDEFRISKGIARWTSNFIPPNASNSFGQTLSPSPLVPIVSLLFMEGNNASTNFVDQTGKVWTAYGNAQIDTAQSKFGGASGLFDGSGDYISTSDSPDFDFGSGDFTIDFWVKRNSNGLQRIAGQMDGGTVTTISWYLHFAANDTVQGVIYSGSTPYIATSTRTVTADGSWHHIAMVRSGNTITLYIDGAADGAVNVAGVVPNNSAYYVSVGRLGEYNLQYLNGWIDEFRVSKGIARWTSNFIPPNSSNSFGQTHTPTATASFTPTVTLTPTLNPFPAIYWSFDETSGTAVNDSVSTNSSGTLIGGAQRVPGYGINAIQLASGQRIDFPRTVEMEPANGFTISAWVYPTEMDQGKTYVILNKGETAQDYRLYINSNKFLAFRVNDLSPAELVGPILRLNEWSHITAIYDRSANMLKLYLNGILVASRSTTGTISYSTASGISISDATNPYIGMIDEIYFSQGSYLDSAITTPTAAAISTLTPNPTPTATATSSFAPTTSLLLMEGADGSTGFVDQIGKVWTAYGNAQIDTAQYKFGTASGLFDGSGDWIETADHDDFNVGSGNFTVDFWFRKAANSINQAAFGQINSAATSSTASILCYPGLASNQPYAAIYDSAGMSYTITSPSTITDTNWHHYALVRNGNTMTLYIDGANVGTKDVTGITINNSSYKPTIGRPGEYSGQYFNGSIDEFRFSKGVARWTSNFIPPSASNTFGQTPTPTSTNTPSRTPSPTLVTYTPTLTSTATPSPASTPDMRWGDGTDGDLTVGTGVYNINTDHVSGRTCADAVAYNVTTLGSIAATVNADAITSCISAGDEILLINLQGTSTSTYNTGAFEFLHVDSILDNGTGNDTVVFTTSKVRWYGDSWRADDNIGIGPTQQKVMLMRVPNYNNVTVNGTLTANPWNGLKYGVIAYRVKGTLLGSSSGNIYAAEKGFNGGAGGASYFTDGWYASPGGNGVGIGKAYTGGGQGANLGAGKGSGGGYGTAGESMWGGIGGMAYGTNTLELLFLGSGGGGGGSADRSSSYGGNGGNGGGIILISAQTIDFSGSLLASGGNGGAGWYGGNPDYGYFPGSEGGGGSGGSIRIEGDQISINSLNASGGIGGFGGYWYGGHGGAGRIAVYYKSTQPTITAANPSTHTFVIGSVATSTPAPTPVSMTPTPRVWSTGNDGDLTVSSTGFNIHSSTQNNERDCMDGGDAVSYAVVQLSDSWAAVYPPPSAGCLKVGDEIMLVNTYGNTSKYGNVGNYEFLKVGGVSGSLVYFITPKTKYYGDNASDDSNIGINSGQQRVMVARVPNYDVVTINGTLTGNAWDGTRYGLIVFRANEIKGSGVIDANTKGYSGGGGGVSYFNSWWHAANGGNGVGIGKAYTGGGQGAIMDVFAARGGGGGYGTAGETVSSGMIGGMPYGTNTLELLFLGSGGGGGGAVDRSDSFGGYGGNGGGIILISAQAINFSGSLLASGGGGGPGWGGHRGSESGGGSGGSIRIEGDQISLNSLNVSGGAGGYGGYWYGGYGGKGRVAVYYQTSFTGNFTPDYIEKAGMSDSLFNADFETGDLSQWSSAVTDTDNDLSASDSADYWYNYGLSAIIDDNTNLYVQNNMPDGNSDTLPDPQTRYHARFYVNPNSVTMASGDILDLFNGYKNGTAVFHVQMQKTATSYQIRTGILNDAGAWTETSWYDITNSWNAIEIDYQALIYDGKITLWLNGVEKQSILYVDNDTRSVTEVRLGTQGVETGTRGTVYFDDFDSRRFSYIGTLPDPGVFDPQATNPAGWETSTYHYLGIQPHAVTSVQVEGGNTNSYEYDQNGNMTCRVENGEAFKQTYNAENRISAIHKMTGDCSTGTAAESWMYTYDGDGVRVSTAHFTALNPNPWEFTAYFMGGSFEVTGSLNGSTFTEIGTKSYYAIAGMTVAMRDSEDELQYLLTDHLGSVVATTDSTGTLISQQRYLPFGGARTDVTSPSVSPTDFTYTGQRDLPGTGLIDYKARMLSPYINRFLQPDSIIPDLSNPQSWNRYSYTINNPIRYNDPSGHCSVEDDADACGAHRRSDPLSSLLKASVAVVFGKLGQSDRNTFGLLGYGLEPGYSPAQGLATAINDNQLVTAEHVALGSPNATHMWIFVGRAYYIYDIGDLIINTDTIPGDFATITLPGGLPHNVTPVPMAKGYHAAPGQHVITIYTIPTLNEMDEITGFDLHALVTTTSNPAVDWVKGWGRQIVMTNPNVLDSGDSGGGVFYNNLLIGVNGDIQPDTGLATIAPSCFTGGGWSIIGGQYYDTPC